MISSLSGMVESRTAQTLEVVTPGGVGYAVRTSMLLSSTYRKGESITLHTYLKVSDSALDLYGFASREERDFFELLLTVRGIGPKGAMNILSLGSLSEIQSAIARGDSKYLTAVQGMGKKTAERLCVELKSKIRVISSEGGADRHEHSDILSEVVDALVNFGYTASDARAVVQQLDAAEKNTEELLREALKHIS